MDAIMPRREGVAEEERSSVALAIPACVLDERLSTRVHFRKFAFERVRACTCVDGYARVSR